MYECLECMLLLRVWTCVLEAVLRCPITYVAVPVMDNRVADERPVLKERCMSNLWGRKKKETKKRKRRDPQKRMQKNTKSGSCSGLCLTLPAYSNPS